MITYAGLARLVGVAAGTLTGTLPPGHVAPRALAAVLRELRSLSGNDDVTSEVTLTPALGPSGRALFRHGCGNVGLGTPVTDREPGYCEQCHQGGCWEPLYLKIPERP